MVGSKKIVSLRAENIKRLSAVYIEPDGNIVLLGGKNAAGKSSVLDSVWYGLGGAGVLPEKPIREGQETAEIEIDLGDIIVRRKFTKSGSTVTVKTKDGAAYSSPQKVLDGLFSKLSFDPLAFASMKPAEQSKALIALLGIDTTELDKEHARLYEERTGVNRLVKEAEADVARCPEILIEVPATRPDLGEISRRLESAIEHRQAMVNRQSAMEQQAATIADHEEELAALVALEPSRKAKYEDSLLTASEQYVEAEREMAARHERELADLRDRQKAEVVRLQDDAKSRSAEIQQRYKQDEVNIKERMQRLSSLIDKERAKLTELESSAGETVPDVDAIRLELKCAEESAYAFDATQDRKQKETRLRLHQEEADELTDRMDALVEKKRQRLAQANYPIEGLAVNESGTVLFNGVPLSQASRAQQIRTSVAIGIAMNPKLKVLLIRDGSLLDDENMEMVADMARQHDAQIWIERVGDRDESAIIIEDGHVRDVEPVAEASPKKTRKKAAQQPA